MIDTCSHVYSAYDSVSHWAKAGAVISGGMTVLSFMICVSTVEAEPGHFSKKCLILSSSIGAGALFLTATLTTALYIRIMCRRKDYEQVLDNS